MTDAEAAGRFVDTPRLRMYVRQGGSASGEPVVFIHGNVSSSTFWDELLAALPSSVRGLAPDLRGYGATETLPVDARRGLRDFVDDLHGLIVGALGLRRPVHLVGWSMGGGIALQYAIDHPTGVASLVLEAPLSPYGFGGTRDTRGTLCWPDYAGSGGGTASAEFVQRLAAGDRGTESPSSPRNVMNAIYFKPPFRVAPKREDAFVDAMLRTRVGPDNYPGDFVGSLNWPGVAPGARGVNNAMSPRFCNLSSIVAVDPQLDVLWIRGADDMIVSDTSTSDFGYLGQLGAVPGWPGAEVYPPQPMVSQTRAVLDAYAARGGQYREVVLPNCGHSPHIEHADAFRQLVLEFIAKRSLAPIS